MRKLIDKSLSRVEPISSLQITLVVGNRLKPIDSELKEVNENELKNDNLESAVAENEETTSI